MTPRARLQKLVTKIVAHDPDLRRPICRPPASEAAIAEFAKAFAGKVPPSFLALASIHDGIEHFTFNWIDLYSLETLTQKHQALEEEWVDAGKFKPGEIFVFGRADHDSEALAFLLQPDASGEMPIIEVHARWGDQGERSSTGIKPDAPRLESYLRKLANEAQLRTG